MIGKIIDFLFPKACVDSRQEGNYMSKSARQKLMPHPDMCPASHRFSKDFLTLPAYRNEFILEGIHICFYYGSVMKKIILKLKYYHQKDVLNDLVDRMILSIQTNHTMMKRINEQSCITYVPSHRWRKYMVKGYNQSELLAIEIAQRLGLNCINVARKIKYNKSQTYLSREKRLKNLEGSFEFDKEADLIRHKNIIIVDDILTTGATISEVAKIINEKHPEINIRGLVAGRHNG